MAVHHARHFCVRNEGKVLLPLPKCPLNLVGCKVLLPLQRKNELVGVWSAKRKYSNNLVTAALVLSSTPPFTSGHRINVGSEAKGKGPGNGPGGHRARETRKQAGTAESKEPGGGGKGGRGQEGSEGYGGLSCFATALANPSRVLFCRRFGLLSALLFCCLASSLFLPLCCSAVWAAYLTSVGPARIPRSGRPQWVLRC